MPLPDAGRWFNSPDASRWTRLYKHRLEVNTRQNQELDSVSPTLFLNLDSAAPMRDMRNNRKTWALIDLSEWFLLSHTGASAAGGGHRRGIGLYIYKSPFCVGCVPKTLASSCTGGKTWPWCFLRHCLMDVGCCQWSTLTKKAKMSYSTFKSITIKSGCCTAFLLLHINLQLFPWTISNHLNWPSCSECLDQSLLHVWAHAVS